MGIFEDSEARKEIAKLRELYENLLRKCDDLSRQPSYTVKAGQNNGFETLACWEEKPPDKETLKRIESNWKKWFAWNLANIFIITGPYEYSIDLPRDRYIISIAVTIQSEVSLSRKNILDIVYNSRFILKADPGTLILDPVPNSILRFNDETFSFSLLNSYELKKTEVVIPAYDYYKAELHFKYTESFPLLVSFSLKSWTPRCNISNP